MPAGAIASRPRSRRSEAVTRTRHISPTDTIITHGYVMASMTATIGLLVLIGIALFVYLIWRSMIYLQLYGAEFSRGDIVTAHGKQYKIVGPGEWGNQYVGMELGSEGTYAPPIFGRMSAVYRNIDEEDIEGLSRVEIIKHEYADGKIDEETMEREINAAVDEEIST